MSFLIKSLLKLNSSSRFINKIRCKELSQFENRFLGKDVLIYFQHVRFAGHAKWQNIRHTKTANDNNKSKVHHKFSARIARIASKGSNPKYNKELANCLDEARKMNVSKECIERAIKRAQTQNQSNIWLGLLGPNGLCILLNFYCDIRFTKPSALIKPITMKYKEIYKQCSKDFAFKNFNSKGYIILDKVDKENNILSYDQIEEIAIEAEAEEFFCEKDKTKETDEKNSKNYEKLCWKLWVDSKTYIQSKGIIEKNFNNVQIIDFGIEYQPKESVNLSDKEIKVFNEVNDQLSKIEEIEQIYTNLKV